MVFLSRASGASSRTCERSTSPLARSRPTPAACSRWCSTCRATAPGRCCGWRTCRSTSAACKAVDGIDIDVQRGTVHALIGPNGSGKTTSLNVVSGIYRPTGGKVILDGEDVSQMKPHQRAGAWRRSHLPEHPPVRLAVGARERDGRRPARQQSDPGRAARRLRDRAMSALQFVGLADRAHVHRAQPALRPPAPGGDRPRAGRASQAAAAGRTGCRPEPDRENGVRRAVEAPARPRPHHLPDRPRHGSGGKGVRPHHGAQLRPQDRRRRAAEVLRNPDVIAAYLGTPETPMPLLELRNVASLLRQRPGAEGHQPARRTGRTGHAARRQWRRQEHDAEDHLGARACPRRAKCCSKASRSSGSARKRSRGWASATCRRAGAFSPA